MREKEAGRESEYELKRKRGREVSSSATWEDETPCEALGVVREELPILYTNSFISNNDGSFYTAGCSRRWRRRRRDRRGS